MDSLIGPFIRSGDKLLKCSPYKTIGSDCTSAKPLPILQRFELKRPHPPCFAHSHNSPWNAHRRRLWRSHRCCLRACWAPSTPCALPAVVLRTACEGLAFRCLLPMSTPFPTSWAVLAQATTGVTHSSAREVSPACFTQGESVCLWSGRDSFSSGCHWFCVGSSPPTEGRWSLSLTHWARKATWAHSATAQA